MIVSSSSSRNKSKRMRRTNCKLYRPFFRTGFKKTLRSSRSQNASDQDANLIALTDPNLSAQDEYRLKMTSNFRFSCKKHASFEFWKRKQNQIQHILSISTTNSVVLQFSTFSFCDRGKYKATSQWYSSGSISYIRKFCRLSLTSHGTCPWPYSWLITPIIHPTILFFTSLTTLLTTRRTFRKIQILFKEV